MTKILFDERAEKNSQAENQTANFLGQVTTLEVKYDMPVIIFQDGASGAYYIKSSLLASDAAKLCDLDAKLDVTSTDSYKTNRQLFLKHMTYQRMAADATKGREFNDIIVEYTVEYAPETPLKVWGGQHRIKAIFGAYTKSDRYHGFRIYFNLNKVQRTEIALVSNTNISVSNDTFDRMIEETIFGGVLRKWCQKVGFLGDKEDFPDVGSRSEKISVKKARSFLVNFYLGEERGRELNSSELDRNVYEPYLVETGVKTGTDREIIADPAYEKIMNQRDILSDESLLKAGQRFLALHNAQYRAVSDPKTSIKKIKGYKNKTFVESVLCGWSYVAGLLQSHPERLENHYRIPKTSGKIPDPLNAKEMSTYKHDKDEATYRGLGTRSALRDRQRVAQLFLAKSLEENVTIDSKFMDKAVSQVIGLLSLSQGYA
ncbi:MAG: hypothetical protein COT43_01490 [Candidatus Marinimicrobia bacterium CG08_land_8_20_14_0_20_45_22]|nr:MAG: hypothetical protein COT43_01490 [Candidatus Marinimicrobia bacterium CG08_land_8_20_14_0_20_45_22]